MICKLKEIRKTKQISQNNIAKELNIGQTTISEWENNKNIPNLKKAYELAKYLGVRVTDIWQ